jgi:hypothetical protein
MDQTTGRTVAEQAISERLRPFITNDKQRDIAARHAVTALLDHPAALRALLADAAAVQRHSVSVRQHMGTVEAGSTTIGYTAR